VSELVAGATIDCDVYHLLALNKKYVPIIRAGEPIKQDRLDKLKEYNEVYIQKTDLGSYTSFVKNHQDSSAKGLASRCRAQFLNLVAGFTDLLLLVSDQSEFTSFEKGRVLYEKVLKLADELMGNLGAVGDAWEIISNSAIGDFGSVERSPAVAAYAGLLSLDNSIGNYVEVMVSALLCNVGLLDLSPSITRKVRTNQQDQFLPEEVQEYQKHPVTSLNLALARRLPLTESIKNAIQYSHERTDGKGFPAGLTGGMIPDEASLIQICEIIDQESLIKWGEQRKKISDVRKNVFEREFMANKAFSVMFMGKIKKSFSS
jgi:response regulator RpfG family c-di-GMP phosphodiesterase